MTQTFFKSIEHILSSVFDSKNDSSQLETVVDCDSNQCLMFSRFSSQVKTAVSYD